MLVASHERIWDWIAKMTPSSCVGMGHTASPNMLPIPISKSPFWMPAASALPFSADSRYSAAADPLHRVTK